MEANVKIAGCGSNSAYSFLCHFCFVHFEALLLGACTFKIVKYYYKLVLYHYKIFLFIIMIPSFLYLMVPIFFLLFPSHSFIIFLGHHRYLHKASTQDFSLRQVVIHFFSRRSLWIYDDQQSISL